MGNIDKPWTGLSPSGNTWLCPEPDCGYGVAGLLSPADPDEPDPILEHEEEHARDREEARQVATPGTAVELVGFAASLMSEALAQGVEVRSVTTSWHPDHLSIGLWATDNGLTPALAVALGLTTRTQQMGNDPTEALEVFEGRIAGVVVSTIHRLPALLVRDSDTGEHLTGPLTPDAAAQVVSASTGRNVEAVAA